MATLKTVELVDDIDGTPAVDTFKIAINDERVDIDLNKKNEKMLREALKPFFDQGRVHVKRVKPQHNAGDVRKWAGENGLKVSPSGRIPDKVVEAYVKAH